MKIYVIESCSDEGGNVINVAKSICECDKIIEKEIENCEMEDIKISNEKNWDTNIVKMYVSEYDQPIFAIREFNLKD